MDQDTVGVNGPGLIEHCVTRGSWSPHSEGRGVGEKFAHWIDHISRMADNMVNVTLYNE